MIDLHWGTVFVCLLKLKFILVLVQELHPQCSPEVIALKRNRQTSVTDCQNKSFLLCSHFLLLPVQAP